MNPCGYSHPTFYSPLPAPPFSSLRFHSCFSRPPDAGIFEAVAAHERGIVQITAVYDNGRAQAALHVVKVRTAKFLPFSHDHETVGAIERCVRRSCIFE